MIYTLQKEGGQKNGLETQIHKGVIYVRNHQTMFGPITVFKFILGRHLAHQEQLLTTMKPCQSQLPMKTTKSVGREQPVVIIHQTSHPLIVIREGRENQQEMGYNTTNSFMMVNHRTQIEKVQNNLKVKGDRIWMKTMITK